MKNACKQFNYKEKIGTAKLYNRNGVAIYEDDLEYTKSGDILYLALNGNEYATLFIQIEKNNIFR